MRQNPYFYSFTGQPTNTSFNNQTSESNENTRILTKFTETLSSNMSTFADKITLLAEAVTQNKSPPIERDPIQRNPTVLNKLIPEEFKGDMSTAMDWLTDFNDIAENN